MKQHFRVSRSVSGAFTLVELLVVVATIALLLAILLPSLRSARSMAKGARCGGQLHGFGAGFGVYFTEHDQWIPGRNTTGMATWVQGYGPNPSGRLADPELPVQVYDWMTPILRTQTQLPTGRANRFRFLLEEYACPEVRFKAVLYVNRPAGEQPPPDHADFEALVAEKGAFPGISYLMPVHFQHWGQDSQHIVGYDPRVPIPYPSQRNPDDWEVRISQYTSRVDELGTPAEKIAVSDGTRYLPWQRPLDFDHDFKPVQFGSFASAGGWWRGSVAYGDDHNLYYWQSGGRNLPLSFRHRDGIGALFFDGHVERLTRKEARKIDYWYPSGSVVVKPFEGYCDYAQYAHGHVIR